MKTETLHLAVVGGGAAGYFAALRAGEARGPIAIFEAGKRPLEKVRISGGGRCNVTHACFEPAKLITGYPRGHRELLGPFHSFHPQDTVDWFEARGAKLKAESDGRMFPVSDSSETIVNCLEVERAKLDVKLFTQCKVTDITRGKDDLFVLETTAGTFTARNVLLAGGSHKSGHEFAAYFGHTITPLAPSLFTFEVADPALHALSGVSVQNAELTLLVGPKRFTQPAGPLLVTHWGLSGPAVLKLSALAARELLTTNYQAKLYVNWTDLTREDQVREEMIYCRDENVKKLVRHTPMFLLPTRLWEYLLTRTIPEERERAWNEISFKAMGKLAAALLKCEFQISGKGQFKEEFVTAGGVKLSEVDFRTMESRITPGLFFAGEVLDIDGITGGFNFQAAWTTGYLAGTAIIDRI